jgi:hypothetical protein
MEISISEVVNRRALKRGGNSYTEEKRGPTD